MQPNGSTALHAATYFGHVEIVKLLLDQGCCRTTLNRYGKRAYEEARTIEMKELFCRPDSASRFHDRDTIHTMAIYIPEENEEAAAASATHDYVHLFKSKAEILEYSLNQQTTAMWFKFYNWFSHSFRSYLESDNFHVDNFDLHKHPDFQQFLKRSLSNPTTIQTTMQSVDEARRRNSIEPLITLYTSEQAGFYGPLNQQLIHSPADAQMSPHLSDRFIIEFQLKRKQLKQRAYTGTVYRGATLPVDSLTIYEHALASTPHGVLGLKAFTSTSIDPLVALAFAIKVPPNDGFKNVLFVFEISEASSSIFGVEDISVFGHEREVLILPGNLFIVTQIEERDDFKITEIHLRHWNVSISFMKKLKQTFRSGSKSVI